MSGWRGVLRCWLPGAWAGMLLCVALIATPAPFATLSAADAGRVVGHIFAREAVVSLAAAVLVLILERAGSAAEHQGLGQSGSSTLSLATLLALGAAFCTIAGYYGLQPLMQAARVGQGSLSFGQLHAISLAFFLAKLIMVLVLGWRVARPESA